jgi:hypothetical protein
MTLDMSIIPRGELPFRSDLIGKQVLCLKSWYPAYKVGEICTVLPSGMGRAEEIMLSNTGRSNGWDAEWKILSPENLDPEEFV